MYTNMKTPTLLTAAFLILALASCTKDDPTPTGNLVEYGAMCNGCTIKVTTATGTRTHRVDGYWQYKERNSLEQINITTDGAGLITTYVTVNGEMLHSSIEQEQDGIEDYVIYDIPQQSNN